MPDSLQPIMHVDPAAFEKAEFQQSLNDYSRVFLAEGDSWFSYGSTKLRNVFSSMQLPYPACVLNISEPGDTLRRMHETTRNEQFYLLSAEQEWPTLERDFLVGRRQRFDGRLVEQECAAFRDTRQAECAGQHRPIESALGHQR